MDACAQGSRGEFPTQRAAFLASVRDSIAETCPSGERVNPAAYDMQARFVAALQEGHAIAQEAASVVRDAVALEQAARKVARG